MADIKARTEARSLRQYGNSISDIARRLRVNKSTVSYWCRDIILTPSQVERLKQKSKHAGTRQFILLGEQRRKARLLSEATERDQGSKDVCSMSKRNLFFLGLGLYWGEGYKNGNGELDFTNSDGRMVLIFLRWLFEIYGVEQCDLIVRVSINAIHKDRIKEVEEYWSRLTGIPPSQFTKTTLIKTDPKKIYKDRKEYHGIFRVKVRRGSSLKQRILGSINTLSQVPVRCARALRVRNCT